MKVYTRTGDGGETSLLGGDRVPKDNRRVATYGEVDELNAALGQVHASVGAFPSLRERVEAVQKTLFGIGGEIACGSDEARGKLRGLVTREDISSLESSIDAMEGDLPRLRGFIVPGGGPAGAAFHVARTVCRRAERAVVTLAGEESVRPEILGYLNRLSDWLFVAARWVNHEEGRAEIPW